MNHALDPDLHLPISTGRIERHDTIAEPQPTGAVCIYFRDEVRDALLTLKREDMRRFAVDVGELHVDRSRAVPRPVDTHVNRLEQEANHQ